MTEIEENSFHSRLAIIIGKEKPFSWASKVGIPSGTFDRIWNHKAYPKAEYLKLISVKIGVSIDWLLTGEGPEKRDGTGIPYIKDADEFAYISMAKGELSANGGLVVMPEEFTNQYAFHKRWIEQAGVAAKKAVLMIVRGDSMEPTLEDGDTVMVDTQRNKLVSGRIYAINCGDDMLQLKRLERTGKKVRVISDNKKIYDPYDVDPQEIIVIGQLIWYARQMTGFDNMGPQ